MCSATRVVGEFNIQLDDVTNTGDSKLVDIVESQDLTQHVEAATRCGLPLMPGRTTLDHC